ncbi:hypothetical protein AB4351_01100 [Vibrio sp. 10N.261.51.F11]|uniref:hypothetical protein n=1 Tax=Vibrio TaxID=662 RepID=UPI000CE2BDDB|nr:hypothetical protein [Vibrio jasicida]CAH6883221.1 conserved hypothetical protein [Vibrio chagasii]
MTIQLVKIQGDETPLFAPFSGVQIAGEGVQSWDKLEEDPTFLFGFCLEAGEFVYINNELSQAVGFDISDVELTVEQLCSMLKVRNGVCIEHNTGWGGSYIVAFGELSVC